MESQRSEEDEIVLVEIDGRDLTIGELSARSELVSLPMELLLYRPGRQLEYLDALIRMEALALAGRARRIGLESVRRGASGRYADASSPRLRSADGHV